MPKIIPYFNMNKNVAISHIAVSRSRCIAVSNQTMEVYEWGYRLGEDSDAMPQFEVIYRLPGFVKQVEAGLEFNLFLLEDGEVWFSGQIVQGEETVFSTEEFGTEPLVNLS